MSGRPRRGSARREASAQRGTRTHANYTCLPNVYVYIYIYI